MFLRLSGIPLSFSSDIISASIDITLSFSFSLTHSLSLSLSLSLAQVPSIAASVSQVSYDRPGCRYFVCAR
jgi:hypothetical protein